jgi:hypothetical protein
LRDYGRDVGVFGCEDCCCFFFPDQARDVYVRVGACEAREDCAADETGCADEEDVGLWRHGVGGF